MRPSALIAGAAGARGALAAARALAAAGWSVGVAAPGGRGIAAASRAVARRHDVPSPEHGTAPFIAALSHALADGGYEVVFAAGDAELLALSAHRDELPAVVPHASHAAVVAALDKLELTEAGRGAGLAVPRTWRAGEPPPGGYSGPVVVKPRLHFDPISGGAARHDAALAADVAEGETLAARLAAAGAEPLLQERVTGRLIAITGVLDPADGLRGTVQQVAGATWPAGAGVTAHGQTVPQNESLARGVEALLRSLGWSGLAEVQFLDPGDGAPRLIDLNGRFYGSLSLAVAAGSNLPALWAALATGRPLPPAQVRAGVRYQWLEGDLRAARAADGARGVARALRRAPKSTHSVWSARDPLPALRYALAVPARARARRRQGLP